MANVVQYRGNQGSTNPANTNRLHSPFVWSDCNIPGIMRGTEDGFYFFDDFVTPYFTIPTTEGVFPPYKAFTSTGGTINPSTFAQFGTVALGSNDDNEGAALSTVGCPVKIATTAGKMWFEARWKVTTTAVTIMDTFVGLMESVATTATVPITATAGTLADKNLVGFHRPGTNTTGDGALIRQTYKADGQAVSNTTSTTSLVADTYIKTALKYDPVTRYITWYLNGIADATYLVTTTAGNPFPNDVTLGLMAGVTNAAGSITDVLTLDWWAFAQMNNGTTVI